jgi:hypothetical protein
MFYPSNGAPVHYAGNPEDASLWINRRPLVDLAEEFLKDKLDKKAYGQKIPG